MIGRIGLTAVGFVAPGMADAAALWADPDGGGNPRGDGWRASPRSLPPREARRASPAIALAVAAAEQIAPTLPRDAGWVFASSLGEGDTLNSILSALCRPDIMIQPLKFQNAVHNAAQGQWSIAAGAPGPGTSIAAHDDTAGAGLLKAAMQVLAEGLPVGLVIFDAPLPPPLHEKRPIEVPMAAALALSPEPGLGLLEIDLVHDTRPTDPAKGGAPPVLLGSNNPVRFVLPLLASISRGDDRPTVLGLPGGGGLAVSYRGPADAF